MESNRNETPILGSRLKIKPPTTTHDSGEPTDNCLFDAKRVIRLVEDERYLSAQTLYQSVQDRIQNNISMMNESAISQGKSSSSLFSRGSKRSGLKRQKSSKKRVEEKSVRAAMEFLEENQEIIQKMQDRYRVFTKARSNLNNDADWTIAQHLFGVTTFYRQEKDGSMSIKLEGTVSDCSVFEQVAVIREFDLNHMWAPFVSSSMTVAHLDKLDIVGWFLIGLPHFGLSRDALFRAIGCDATYEDGSVLIIGQGIADRPKENECKGEEDDKNQDQGIRAMSSFGSIDVEAEDSRILNEIREDPVLDTLDLPPVPTRVGGGRLTIRSIAAQIHVDSLSSSTLKLVMNVDPNMHLIPQPLLDFVMKRMCGAVLHKMQGAAKNISKDPIYNLHAIRIREDKEFYKNFLLPKFEGVCKVRGWKMPAIAAFELSDAQLEMADAFLSKQKHKSEKMAIEHLNANTPDSGLEQFLESSSPHVSANDSPRVRTVQNHSDDMSDISKFSTFSSFWRSNPISNYKREWDEKEQRRKNQEIEESRARAAKRLRPKSLNEDSLKRLKELQRARDRRRQRDAKESNAELDNGAKVDLEDCIESKSMISFQSHGFFKKVFVLQFLLVSLFCLLYLDVAFDKFVAVKDDTFGAERRRDLSMLIYVVLAGSVHFMFCYVALMYAFSALQLGSIAGKRTKQFYSNYVHFAVAMASASMIAVGIMKPGIDRTLRWTIWNVHSISGTVRMFLLSRTPVQITSGLTLLLKGGISLISSTKELIFETNVLGRVLVSTSNSLFGALFASVQYPFTTYAKIAIKQYESKLDSIPWREDSYFTIRALLSHSAFFLIVVLVLFNAAAKKARRAIYKDVDVTS